MKIEEGKGITKKEKKYNITRLGVRGESELVMFAFFSLTRIFPSSLRAQLSDTLLPFHGPRVHRMECSEEFPALSLSQWIRTDVTILLKDRSTLVASML